MKKRRRLKARHFVFDKYKGKKEIPRGLAGCAFQYDGERHFLLKLNIFSGRTFYVIPNKGGRKGPDYWIFSRRAYFKKGTPNHFQVGYGNRAKGVINAIDLYLFDLDRTYELCLEPEDFHYNQAA